MKVINGREWRECAYEFREDINFRCPFLAVLYTRKMAFRENPTSPLSK